MISIQIKWWKYFFAELVDDDGMCKLRFPDGEGGGYIGKAELTDINISYKDVGNLIKIEAENGKP